MGKEVNPKNNEGTDNSVPTTQRRIVSVPLGVEGVSQLEFPSKAKFSGKMIRPASNSGDTILRVVMNTRATSSGWVFHARENTRRLLVNVGGVGQ